MNQADPSAAPPPNLERLPPPAGVQEQLPLEFLETLAFSNNPALCQAWGQVIAAQGQYIQAGLPFNPAVGYSGQQITSYKSQQDGLIVTQEFIRGHKLTLAQQAAAHNWEKTRRRYQAQRMRVQTDVRLAYWDVIVAQRLAQLEARLIDIAQQSQSTAKQLFDAKEGTRIDLLQSKIEADQARLDYGRALNRADAAWQQLSAVVGVQLTPQTLAGNLGELGEGITWETAIDRVLAANPELAAAQSDIERARWQLQRELAEPIPNLTVQAIVQHDTDIKNWDGALQATLPLPLLNRNQGNILQARGDIQTAECQAQRIRQQFVSSLANTYQRYRDSRLAAERYEQEILPAAEESLGLVLQGFRGGEFGFKDVLIAQRTLFNARVNHVEALGRFQQAQVEIEGLLLSGSLTQEPR
jgi:cobalt-zinc-cadmium efflux system outer membrane protein